MDGGVRLKKKLLMVDDSNFMRLIMKKALEDADIQIIEASNGLEAVNLYKSESPNLVTMDMAMPVKNGMEALMEIVEFDSGAKVVMCSSMVYEENVSEAIGKGALAFIEKPFSNELYLSVVKKYLQLNEQVGRHGKEV